MTLPQTDTPDLARFSTTPRAVRRRRRAWLKIIALRIVLLPLVLVGAASIFAVAVQLAWVLNGTEHEATVDRQQVQGNARTYRVDYHYLSNGITRRGSATISADVYPTAEGRPPAAVRVRSIGLGPWIYDPVLAPGDSPFDVAAPMLFVLLLGVLLGMGCYFFSFSLPRRSRLLYESGSAAPGHIVKKIQRVQGKTIALVLTYDFSPSTGPERSGVLSVWRRLFATAKEGEAIVILYDPGNPERNVVYEYGDYELVPSIVRG